MVRRLDFTHSGLDAVAVALSRRMRDDPPILSDPPDGDWRLAEERGW